MNIFPPSEGADPPAAPAEWTMEIGVDHTGEGIVYFADVKRAGREMCRIALAGCVPDEAAARRILAAKARIWIDEFLRRDGRNDGE
jgi:hypothetical protein